MPGRAKFCSECGAASALAGPPSGQTRLIRPREGKKIAGVCAAFAHYFDADVTLIRVVWVVLCLWPVPTFGVLAYFAAWFAIPREAAIAPQAAVTRA